MTIFVGLRFDEETTQRLYQWFLSCQDKDCGFFELERPVHPDFIGIPLAYHNGTRLDHYQPLGKIDRIVKFDRARVRWVGNRNTIVLAFYDEWVWQRIEDLIQFGFPRRRYSAKKKMCRLPMSICSHSLSDRWLGKLPFKEARVVEEYTIPFDNRFISYAHMGKEKAIEEGFL